MRPSGGEERQKGKRRFFRSILKVQKRTLPWGWYFMGFGMKGGLDEGDGSCAEGTYAEEK